MSSARRVECSQVGGGGGTRISGREDTQERVKDEVKAEVN